MKATRGLRQFAVALAAALAACAALAVRAQAQLPGEGGRIDLWPHVQVLLDPTHELGLEQALAQRERFGKPPGAYATLGFLKEVVWVRVPLAVAPGGEGAWVLDLDYPLLRHVDVYVLRDGKVATHAVVGHGQRYAQRPLAARTHAVSLDLAPGSSELWLRVDTPGSKILPLSLARPSVFLAYSLDEQLLQGALGGVALFLLLFSLSQWASLREPLYLKYALLVSCSAVFSIHFFGIGEMYLWTDLDWFGTHLAGVSSLMAAGATALFVEDALSGELNAWLRNAFLAVAALHFAAAGAYGANVIDIQTVAVLMSTTGLAPALMGVPGAIAKARRGDSVGAWFIAAWLGYFIASAIMVGVVRGRLGVSFWSMHSFQFGSAFDMLVFMRIAVLRTAARHREAQRAADERDALHSLAHTDSLTGLLNRRGLDDALGVAMARASTERLLALFMLDLDGFKPVNDRFGHDVGDKLLQLVALRLRSSMRAHDAVARLGGDEFVVMAEGLSNEGQARDLGLKLLDAFRAPFTIGENSCSVSATIGYALAPPDATHAQAVVKAADAAMYAGKQAGKDRLLRVGA